jgi:hypothetical protein
MQLTLNYNWTNYIIQTLMRQIIISAICVLTSAVTFGQSLIKIGDKAPKYYFTKIVNSPKTELDISDLIGKPTILAFWGHGALLVFLK